MNIIYTENGNDKLPTLYSLRNCPFAIRARLGLFKAKQSVCLRSIILTNKPHKMLLASPKGTVPVLVFDNGKVIDESLDIMLWALKKTDPNNLLQLREGDEGDGENKTLNEMLKFIHEFDVEFKKCLEEYKCAKRYKEDNILSLRENCEIYVAKLEQRLNHHQFLFSNNESLADLALLPFLRQFARVERQWYLTSPYPKLRLWINYYLQSSDFTKVMTKYPLWSEGDEDIFFGQ
jgi:glutathione S-transferase